MTREETKKILMNIQCSYANWKPAGDLGFMVDIWCDDLEGYSYEQVYTALKIYKTTDRSGFAPNVGQLIDKIHSMNPVKQLNANEAWALVYKALCNSTYHAQEEFDALPELVQKAVGSADNLRSMASDSNFNEGVEKSLFSKVYETTVKSEDDMLRLPVDLRKMINDSNLKFIGEGND